MTLTLFFLRRIARTVLTAGVIASLAFCLLRLLPGDPAIALLGPQATNESVAALRTELGLDQGLASQYRLYMSSVLGGDLGLSLAYRAPVLDLIVARLPVTLLLTGMAVFIALVLTLPLAFWSALRPGSVADFVIQLMLQISLSTPIFYLGLLLLILLSVNAGWFPVGGMGDGWLDRLHHLALPAFTLAISLIGILVRNLRDAIRQILSAEFVTFALSKGLPLRSVLLRHVLRNAMVSTLTLLGLHIGALVSGSVVIESVFSISGIGRLMIDSIFMRDYAMVQGLIVVIAVLVSLVLTFTDSMLALLDPRTVR